MKWRQFPSLDVLTTGKCPNKILDARELDATNFLRQMHVNVNESSVSPNQNGDRFVSTTAAGQVLMTRVALPWQALDVRPILVLAYRG